MTRLSDEQRLAWLRLIRTEGVGPRTFRSMVNRFGGAAPALEALPGLLRRSGRRARITTREEAEQELVDLVRIGARLIATGEPDYPPPLQEIDDAPPLIAVRGDAAILLRPAVAIVGARNASGAGLSFTERLAAEIGGAGYAVVSGLARGIDSRAHRAALATGTIAVVAGGLSRIYPPENEPLLEAILARGGAVVSEMPFGWEARGRDFPRRNRIVSGLSRGVVVVEAARRSGSLITARFALEQGREVFAVPGSPLDPRSEGTNDLIRQGAVLCAAPEHVAEVLDRFVPGRAEPSPTMREGGEGGRSASTRYWDEWELDGPPIPTAEPSLPGIEPSLPAGPEARIVALLGPAPIHADILARETGLAVGIVHSVLLELELAGRLMRQADGTVSLAA